MKRVLVVEDDRLVAELERDFLEAAGYGVEIACDGQQGLEAALAGGWDAIVLDVMLPGRSGFDVCREVRKASDAPIVMVTARDEDADAIRGLGLGADDYVRKPFGAAELRAKVAAHLRRERRERTHALSFGDVRLDLAAREAYVRDARVALTKTEFDVCEFLARHPGQVFSRDQIVEGVLGWDAESGAATISVHVGNARAKLKAAGAEPIETVWGVGYKWTA